MWFDTPYGYAYAPEHSGLRVVYARRGYRQVSDDEVVGLQPQDTADQHEQHDDGDQLDAVHQAITDEVPERERAPRRRRKG